MSNSQALIHPKLVSNAGNRSVMCLHMLFIIFTSNTLTLRDVNSRLERLNS